MGLMWCVQEELEVANDENRHFCRTPGCRGILTVTVEQVQVREG